jgi:pSer/pThr/pTyr-binding forkhead associated (FHA) protein
MKLVFPNGEHGQVFLNPGANRIGSDIDNTIVLNRPGVLPLHCVIHITGTGANLQVPQGAGPVTVNGKPVPDIMGLRSGDSIAIGPVQAKFAVVEEAKVSAFGGDPAEDNNATRVRMAIPKFVLRGVSGAVFSKVFPVAGPVVIGRAPECDISVPADEMSRRHAMVKPSPDGLQVEDLGSSNGTFINNKRIQPTGFLSPGDELRLDTVRFILVAPGMEISAAPPQPAAKPAGGSIASSNKIQLVAMVLTFAALALVVVILVSRMGGKGG